MSGIVGNPKTEFSNVAAQLLQDTVEEKMSFAFAIYDPVNPEADVDGKVIFFSDCYPRDLPTSVSANISQK